jgi:hypothetical protein
VQAAGGGGARHHPGAHPCGAHESTRNEVEVIVDVAEHQPHQLGH